MSKIPLKNIRNQIEGVFPHKNKRPRKNEREIYKLKISLQREN